MPEHKPNPIYTLEGSFLHRNGQLILILQNSANAGAVRDEAEIRLLREHIVKLLNQAAGT